MTTTPGSEPNDAPLPGGRAGSYWPAVLLVVGLLLFAGTYDAKNTPQYVATAVLAAVVTGVPGVRRQISGLLDRVQTPAPKQRRITFFIVFFLSGWYLVLSATHWERGLYPMFHDEFMYLLQARMLAGGHLWMPRHELAPFFESFNVIVEPAYAATYFPGTAMLYVPGVWLGLAPWVTGVVITALAVAMLYVVMTDLFDGVAGVLAAFMAVGLYQLRAFSVMTESHPVLLLQLLVATWCYLRWRRGRKVGWAAAFGVVAGWAAITRPLDAACLIGPLCVLVTWDVFRATRAGDDTVPTRDTTGRRITTAIATLAIIVAATAPFFLLQAAFNKHVTGSYLETPFGMYARANFPGLGFGYGKRTVPAESSSPLPQVRAYYADFLRPDLEGHGSKPFARTWLVDRLAPAADVALPAHAFYALLPLGLLCLRRQPPRAALAAAGVLVLPLAYTFYPSYLRHYGLVCVPAFFTLALGGESLLRRSVLPRAVAPALPIAIAILCVASLPELRGTRDPVIQAPYLADVNDKLAHLDRTPAVVLFHYDPGRTDLHEEPVYNLDTAWPDDAPVIRAQDLGPENWRIFDYYARRQPKRFFYLYNRTTTELVPLGYAGELAARARPKK